MTDPQKNCPLHYPALKIVQDWDAFLQKYGKLHLLRTTLHEDPERPFRISFFKRVDARISEGRRGG